MRKISALISLGVMVLNACLPATIPIPTIATQPLNMPTLIPTKTITPSPTIISTPSLEPISGGWSTFHSPEFGFSLQYPAIYNTGFQSFEFICDISVEENNSDNLLVIIGDIRLIAEKTNNNLAEFTNYYKENNRQGWNVGQTEIDINNLIANRLEYQREKPPRSGIVTILVKEKNAIVIEYFEINFVNCGLKNDGYSSYWVYERVVESLRFQP